MTASPLPSRIGWSQPHGLRVELESHGALRRLALGDVVVNLFVGNALEGGPANLVLRRLGAQPESVLLLGPRSPTRWHADTAGQQLDGHGSWQDLAWQVSLRLAADAPAWFWHVRVENQGTETVRVDLMAWQDLALTDYGAIRLNEYYVSQYIDHTPLDHPDRGTVLASRQNQAVGGRFPWCVMGSLNRAVAHATDALQVHGLATRAGLAPPALANGLPSSRLQHEHAMLALQDAPSEIAPRQSVELGFFGRVLPDHPEATSAGDLAWVDASLGLPEAKPPRARAADAALPAAPSLFSAAPLVPARELDEAALDRVFGTERRHVERDAQGRVSSFFHGTDSHVALRSKELTVLRPHGQVLRTGRGSLPDESGLTSTAWMGGVFHSMLTQGHVSINRCLSTVRSYLGLFRSQGLRVFIDGGEGWQLLDQPSAFEMQPDRCRWIYRHAGGQVEVSSRAYSDPHAFGLDIVFSEGPPMRCLLSWHAALDGDDGSTLGAARWTRDGRSVLLAPPAGSDMARRFPTGHLRIEPVGDTPLEQVGGDERLFLDGLSRGLPFLTLATAACRAARFLLHGRFVVDGPDVPAATDPAADAPRLGLELPVDGAADGALARLGEFLPWLEQNARVHYLSPRGLEQFSGGGWGTRDVCQGPLEYLLAQARHGAVRNLLLRVMRAQRGDGDWPQWFMFFERDAAIRAGDSHGDIVFWPLLALGQYLVASGDASILDEHVPFYSARRSQRAGTGPTVWRHVLRALALSRRRMIAGTALAAYGHGDWNDALQPADPAMRAHMCSAWTVTLHHQTLTTLALGLRGIGRRATAARFSRQAATIAKDFQRLLIVDGVLTGYARFDGDRPTYLLHPRDDSTGVHYSSLAMIHAIIEGLLDPAQMRDHLRLIEARLSGPDGARLFDRPMSYRGGLQRHFQRAESASYFGREIGLMYTHAHLRFAQALAHAGEAERFFRALCQANPIGLRELVASAAIRPSNSYYSSSDAAFADRYQASAEYGRVADGSIALEGGWRVYSSGAGILFGLVIRHLFGLRLEADVLVIDPVMPESLDGTRARIKLMGETVVFEYRVRAPGFGVRALASNERSVPFAVRDNPYRRGAAEVRLKELGLGSGQAPRHVVVHIGG